jgi:hypothetical protein
MLTLTYRDDADWEANHVRDLTQRMRVWFGRCTAKQHRLRYQWVLELTKRGRPHYHCLVWVPRHLMLPHLDKRGWWSHGLTRVEVARNAVGYLAKYASKGFGTDLCDANGKPYRVPHGARICGGGGLGPDQIELRYWMTPRWFRERVPEITDVRRVPGVGYVCTASGELHESPWQFVGCTPGFTELIFVPRRTDARPVQSEPRAMACAH